MRRLKFAVGLMSLTVITALAGLVLVATALPAVMGWDRVVLTSGSMLPLIEPGDVVLVSKVEHPVQPGTVITFKNPNKPGSLITHRVMEVRPDGSYRTKGDANPQPDVSPVKQEMVLGKGTILVPSIGLPAVWLQKGNTTLAVAAIAAVLLIAALSRYGLLRRHDPWLTAGGSGALPAVWRIPVPRWARAAGLLLVLALAAAGIWLAPRPAQGAFSAASSSPQNILSVAAPSNVFYLKTNGTTNTNPPLLDAPLELSASAPTLTTLYNYDVLRDPANPGLLVAKGGGLLDPIVGTTMQRWAMPTRASAVITGNVKARVWTAMKDFSPTKTGSLTAGLYICNPGTNNCTAAGTPATVTSQGSWSGGSTTWVSTDFDLGSISVPTNRVLQLRVTVGTASSDAMMLAYDTTAYPSRVTVG
jgi:signal peptidase